jgi:dihydroxy-acid dehydratase
LAVLRGNIAPRGAIAKPSAVPEDLFFFEGRARVFDGEKEAIEAIIKNEVGNGDVVVIRYEGPRASGMPEMFKPMKLMKGKGIKAALVTDGRFSGSNNGLFVGHISPEAAAGGPIALIENGDVIKIHIGHRRIDVVSADGERSMDGIARVFEERRTKTSAKRGNESVIKNSILSIYSDLAVSAMKGAYMEAGI